MSKKHTYVLGLNTYDHDVSACLLRDGAVAFAIAKERITREKHASGFFKEVIDYCLGAEGIGIGDIDLVVRNCYILPVPEMEERLIYQDMPGFLPPRNARTRTTIRISARVPTRWCQSHTIWRTPIAPLRPARSMRARS